MDDKDKIDVLLKEYDTLKAEILQRIRSRFAFLGLFISVGAFGLFKASDINSFKIGVLFFTALFLFAVWWQLGFVIKRCSKRIAEIEVVINQIAGEKLLRWENEQLGSKIFHLFHR
ncbi:hypothetical protein [uncultured Desulfobacter sp.]|uniref:hypothetical protein n=1 Tax=uncultured Desulfobacter sp. TaxID=240139 RepID=UPI0029C61D61|nr:hypothetical protein [uncultured Desulfobacter sp.]